MLKINKYIIIIIFLFKKCFFYINSGKFENYNSNPSFKDYVTINFLLLTKEPVTIYFLSCEEKFFNPSNSFATFSALRASYFNLKQKKFSFQAVIRINFMSPKNPSLITIVFHLTSYFLMFLMDSLIFINFLNRYEWRITESIYKYPHSGIVYGSYLSNI